MEKAKPYENIALRFQISKESAKYFLIHVQKSFKIEKPPQQLISDFMEGKNYKTLPKPHQVATLMNTSGLWTYPLNAAPPGPVDEEDIYF